MVGSTGSTKPQPKSNTQNTAGNTYDTTCSNERAAYDMRHIRNTACNDSGAMQQEPRRTRCNSIQWTESPELQCQVSNVESYQRFRIASTVVTHVYCLYSSTARELPAVLVLHSLQQYFGYGTGPPATADVSLRSAVQCSAVQCSAVQCTARGRLVLGLCCTHGILSTRSAPGTAWSHPPRRFVQPQPAAAVWHCRQHSRDDQRHPLQCADN